MSSQLIQKHRNEVPFCPTTYVTHSTMPGVVWTHDTVHASKGVALCAHSHCPLHRSSLRSSKNSDAAAVPAPARLTASTDFMHPAVAMSGFRPGQCTQVAASCPRPRGCPPRPTAPGSQAVRLLHGRGFITKGGLKSEALSLSCQTSPGARCRRHNCTIPLQRR